ncbi:MAG: alpha/beta hydrolase [Burkholderiales bacterium]|nr:alpha/beta hydrolase [Burkholderiales bacterium]
MSGPADAPIEIETGRDPSHAVIWLHGLGADGNDFVPLIEELDLPPTPLRFVFPNAPMQPVTINHGYVMRAWYDIAGSESGRREDESGVRASQAALEALIAREDARGIAPERVVLAGFSQGGAIALQTGLRHARRLAGIMGLSTYVPLAHTLQTERHPANLATPIFLAHGVEDDVISLHAARRSRDLLEGLGYPVQWHEYPMPHSVCVQEIGDIGAWLHRIVL